MPSKCEITELPPLTVTRKVKCEIFSHDESNGACSDLPRSKSKAVSFPAANRQQSGHFGWRDWSENDEGELRIKIQAVASSKTGGIDNEKRWVLPQLFELQKAAFRSFFDGEDGTETMAVFQASNRYLDRPKGVGIARYAWVDFVSNELGFPGRFDSFLPPSLTRVVSSCPSSLLLFIYYYYFLNRFIFPSHMLRT